MPPEDRANRYSAYKIPALDQIHRVHGYADNSYTYYPVVIIGSGESGICMAYKLKHRLGLHNFKIYDRQSGLGGTWVSFRIITIFPFIYDQPLQPADA